LRVEEQLEHSMHEGAPDRARAGRFREPVDDAEPEQQRALLEVGGTRGGQPGPGGRAIAGTGGAGLWSGHAAQGTARRGHRDGA